MSRLPVTADVHVYHGDSWSQTFTFKQGDVPVDLTSATVECEIRDRPGERTALVCSVNGTPGQVTILPPDPQPPPGRYEYDVQVTDAGVVTTWVRGVLLIEEDVTDAV